MSKQIIIDWQKDGLLVASGHRRGGVVVLDRIVRPSPDTASSQQLLSAIKELGAAKSEVTVIVPRELIEVRTLQIPRAEPDELPEIVRFQAQRQMANMGDNWAVDYVLLPDSPGQESLSALAFTIAPGVMTEIETACANAELKLSRVVTRPIEVARYATSIGGLPTQGVTLAICLSEGQGDLLLLRDGRVVQIRGTRLPSDPDQLATALTGELRRSLLAAASSLSGQTISKTLLIAAADLAQKVEVQVAEITNSEVILSDPATLLPPTLERKSELVHSTASRLAAIAAVVNEPAPDKQSVIDLKNPKRRPPKKKHTVRNALIAACAVVLALGGYTWWLSVNRDLDDQIEELVSANKSLEAEVEKANKKIADRKEVDGFLAGSLNLLDELEFISKRVPAAEKLRFGLPQFQVATEVINKEKIPVGKFSMGVFADSAETINSLKEQFDDPKHEIELTNRIDSKTKVDELYGWESTSTITVRDAGWAPPLNAPTPTRAAKESTPQAPGAQQAETKKAETKKLEQAEQKVEPDAESQAASSGTANGA